MKLFCAIVGEEDAVFAVEINASLLVGDLMKAIKEEIPDTIKCDAYELKLYLAKQGTEWLQEVKLKELYGFPSFERMMSSFPIDHVKFGFPDDNSHQPGEIHVLIEIPGSHLSLKSILTEKPPHPKRKACWVQLNEILEKNAKKPKASNSTVYS